MIDLSTGPALKAARRQFGLTQTQVAIRAGTSQATVAQWEGKRVLPAVTQERLKLCFANPPMPARTPEEAAQSDIDAAYDDAVRALTVLHRLALQAGVERTLPRSLRVEAAHGESVEAMLARAAQKPETPNEN